MKQAIYSQFMRYREFNESNLEHEQISKKAVRHVMNKNVIMFVHEVCAIRFTNKWHEIVISKTTHTR